MKEEIKKQVLWEKIIDKAGNDLIDYEIPKSEIDEVIEFTIQKTARTIFEALKCPECNECEDYEEAWDMLINLIEKVKKEFEVEG